LCVWVVFCVLGCGNQYLVCDSVGKIIGIKIVVKLSGSIWFGQFVESFCLLCGCGSCGEIDFTFESIHIGGHGGGLRVVIGLLRDWMVNVRDKCQVFANVIGEHWQQIVVKPLLAFLKVCSGGYHHKFPWIHRGFDGVAPGSVEEYVLNGLLGGFGDQMIGVNFQIECFCSESDNRNRSCRCEKLIVFAYERRIRFTTDRLASLVGINFSAGLLSVQFLVI